MNDNVRESVVTGQSLPEQDLRVPMKHALVDLGTDLKAECEAQSIPYSTASKALSGHHDVPDGAVRDLFQEILHRWKPGSFQPAPGQDDLVVGFAERLNELDDTIEAAEQKQ